jgi:hypothetical protein
VQFHNVEIELRCQALMVAMVEKLQLVLFNLQRKQVTQKQELLQSVVSSLLKSAVAER